MINNEEGGSVRVLAVVGDYYHDEKLFKDTLDKVTHSIEEVEVMYTDRKNVIDKLNLQPSLVILAAENRLNPEDENVKSWMTTEDAEAIDTYVKKGGSWFAWHSGLAGYEELTEYVKLLGGYFTHHPDDHAQVRYTFKESSLYKEKQPSFEISDEHYFVQLMGEVDVFLESSSKDGDSIAGWTKTVGKGKVAAYTPAHKEEGLSHPQVHKDLTSIIKWCVSS